MNWPLVPLGEVLTRNENRITLAADQTYREVTVRLWGNGVTLRRLATGAEIASDSRFVVRRGQFIASRIDARNGAFGLIPAELDGAIVTGDFPTFNVKAERLLPEYLGWFCRTSGFVDLARAASEGTTNRVRLKEEKFLRTAIPLLPVEEQRQIVARVDAIASRVTEARRLRDEACTETDAYFSALARGCFVARESWQWLPVDALADVRGGIQKSPDRAPSANPVRYLTVAHVHRNRVITTDPRYFEVSPEELERWRLLAGDVLIIEGNGSADQIGRTALFRGEIVDCVHQNHVIRIRPKREVIEPEYLNAFLNSPVGQAAVQAESRTSSGLRSLSVGRIKTIGVAVPPLDEQRRIVAHLDALHAKLEAVRAEQRATAAELDALLPSVLNRAFAGQL